MTDVEVFQQAKDALINLNPIASDILFLHFDAPDAAGHGHGFSPNVTEYAQSLKQTDQYVKQLFTIINNKRAAGEDWLIFIVSDHGGDGRGHG
ncbi:MAG TPA: AP endonuclease, partial [Chromatiaceae bacterium]|nr:AP endonuclease [Chromatiaceae bacterium]